MGFPLIGTKGTAAAITAAGIPCETVNKVTEGRPHVVDMIKNNEIVMVINTVEERRNAIADSRAIRTSALLARRSGYGAGVDAPGWYRHLATAPDAAPSSEEARFGEAASTAHLHPTATMHGARRLLRLLFILSPFAAAAAASAQADSAAQPRPQPAVHPSAVIDPDAVIAPDAPPEVMSELKAVYALLDRLPAEQRIALVLRRIEGMELAEIAAHMKLSLATVKARQAELEAWRAARFRCESNPMAKPCRVHARRSSPPPAGSRCGRRHMPLGADRVAVKDVVA